jgi:hypothetical protein
MIKNTIYNNYDCLGHDFIPLGKLGPFSKIENGWWHECSICHVKVWTHSFIKNKFTYWERNLFHKPNFDDRYAGDPVVEFNLTCEEIIIKSIIE